VSVPPSGYTPPTDVFLGEEVNEADEVAQIGGFFSEDEANTLLERLLGEGREVHINVVAIHRRAADYEWHR
jgi:hypothetical protein